MTAKAAAMSVQTFEKLMKGRRWEAILRLLTKKNATIRVIESLVVMGRYSAVILTGKGFQRESGRGGMSAAYAGNNPTFSPIKSATEVQETVLRYNEPLDEHDKCPTESEIIADLLSKVEKIRAGK